MRPVVLVLISSAALWSQSARAKEEVAVRRGPDGEIVGKLTAGEETQVRSRITTETGSWCRIAAGSVPCLSLEIAPPAPVRVEVAPAPSRSKTAGVAAKPERTVAVAPALEDQDAIEHPTPRQMQRAFPNRGDIRATHDTTPQTSLLQEYKFADNDDASVALWVRPAGDAVPAGNAELAARFANVPERAKPHPIGGGRKLYWSSKDGEFVITGLSPARDYEWTMIFATPEDPQDVTSYVLAGAAAVDRLLFGR
jgi:hypothetical protein